MSHRCSRTSLGLLGLALANLVPCLAAAAWPTDPLVNVPLCTAAGGQANPSIVEDGAGGVIVAWQDHRNGYPDIYAQHILADGTIDPTWPANGLAVCSAAYAQDLPVVVSDVGGGAIVTWEDSRSGVGDGHYDVFAHHVLANGSVDPDWPVDGRALCTAAGDQRRPKLVADGTGGAIVVWEDSRGPASFAVYAQRVLANGQVDPSWPADGRALRTGAIDPKIAADGAGGAIVVCEALPNLGVYAQHVLANGSFDPSWPIDGRAVCSAAGLQTNATILADGTGGAMVAWQDMRSGQYDIYVQHVLAGGMLDPGWPADGRALCTAEQSQDTPAIVADGAGGAIVVWQDARSGNYYNEFWINYDVYAQHVGANGAVDPVWPINGRALCTSVGYRPAPRLVADGAGGVVVTLMDNPISAWDTYIDITAQHVLANGSVDPAWPFEGRAVCSAVHEQGNPTIVADGRGGVIISWHDQRAGAADIYAQRVQANGQLGGEVVGVRSEGPDALVLDPLRPNPSRGGVMTVRFTLPSAATASVDLLDVSGRRIAARDVGSLGPGRHSLELGTGGRLSAGLYFVRLRQGTSMRVQRVTLLN